MSEAWSDLLTLLDSRKIPELKQRLEETNEVDIADFFAQLPVEQTTRLYRMLTKDKASDVFVCLDVEIQQEIINAANDKEIVDIIGDMYTDDAVDLLEELPATVVRRILETAKPETRKLLNQYLNYPDNSAGSIMTAELMNLKKNLTVAEAFTRIRENCSEKEDVYTCYVTNENRFLQGIITVKQMLMAKDSEIIGDIMSESIISAVTTDDREEVAEKFKKYGLLSLPVVDRENRLVGIITVDDVMEVITSEATEDIELMAAVAPSEKPYLKTGIFSLAKNRIIWLLVLMVSSTLTGFILTYYNSAFAVVPLLVTFIPSLTDTGGNAGSQVAALVIRGLALNELHPADFLRVLWKELRVSLCVGGVLSVVNFIRIVIFYPGQEKIALIVSISLIITIVIAKCVGGTLPLLAKTIKLDPALMAAPLITTMVDALALVAYFMIATAMLGI